MEKGLVYKQLHEKLNILRKMTNFSLKTLFDDFCLMASASFHNMLYSQKKCPLSAAYREMHDILEQEFKDTWQKYKTDAREKFTEMRAYLLISLAETPFADNLGYLYEYLKLGDKSLGQIFTPMQVCELMAEMLIEPMERKYAANKLVRISDPCCGSGRMIIAMGNVLRHDRGIVDYQRKTYVELWDIDHICARMAYLNMTLLAIPARVILGDSLTRKINRTYDTPSLQIGIDKGFVPNKDSSRETDGRLRLM
jgi:type I restriction-modification system DNA methylase subunit